MKMKVFGRTVPAVAIALVAMAALASAGLLSYYGKFTGTANIEQSVKVANETSNNGPIWKQCTVTEEGVKECDLSFTVSGIAGNDITNIVYVKNDADNPANVKLDTICPEDFSYEKEVARGIKVECYTADPENGGKLGLTIQYTLTDKEGAQATPTSEGVYTLSKDASPYSLEIKYIFALNAEPKSYDVVTQVVPA
jgi:hypothetical protein